MLFVLFFYLILCLCYSSVLPSHLIWIPVTSATHRLHQLNCIQFVLKLVLHVLDCLLDLFDLFIYCILSCSLSLLVSFGWTTTRGRRHWRTWKLCEHIIPNTANFLLQLFNDLFVCLDRRIAVLKLCIYLSFELLTDTAAGTFNSTNTVRWAMRCPGEARNR